MTQTVNEKSLEELADEYYDAAAVLTVRIHDRNRMLKEYPPASRRAGELKSELRVLYAERAEIMQNAEILKNYYDEEEI